MKTYTLYLALILCFLEKANAVNYVTISNGAWNVAGTWLPSVPPCNLTAGNTIVINHALTMTCNITITGSITIAGSGQLTGNRTITINSGGNFINNGVFTTTNNININSGGNITNNGTLTSSNGDINVNSGGIFSNSGTVSVLDVDNQGTITNNASGVITTVDDLNNQGGVFLNNGSISVGDDLVNDPGTFTNNGILNVLDDINNQDGIFVNNGGIIVSDNLDNQSGTWTENGNTSVAGTFDNTSGGLLNGNTQLCADPIDNGGGTISGTIDVCDCGGSGNPISGGGTIGGGVTICTRTLPIELIYFNAQQVDNSIKLEWITATEKNNKYFTLEKSEDGSDFFTLNQILSKAVNGNSSSNIQYSCLDDVPLEGVSYYRLKQTDYNGESSCSNIISVSYVPSDNIIFTVYPNPNSGQFTVDFSGIENNHDIQIVLQNHEGKVVFESAFSTSDGLKTFKILPSPKLTPGTYVCSLISEGIKYSAKVMVE